MARDPPGTPEGVTGGIWGERSARGRDSFRNQGEGSKYGMNQVFVSGSQWVMGIGDIISAGSRKEFHQTERVVRVENRRV